jgi:hypothetical protein
MLPDGLEQFFRRRGTAVVQHVDGAVAFAPDGVEIFGAGIHGAVFCAAGGKVKRVEQQSNEAKSGGNLVPLFPCC